VQTSPRWEHPQTLKTRYYAFLAPIVNSLVCASFLPNSVATMSGASSSVNVLTVVFTNDLTQVLLGGSQTRKTEDCLSSFVCSVEYLTSHWILYSRSTVLYDWFSGSHIWLFSPRFHSVPKCIFVDSPDPLTGHSYLLHTQCVFVGKKGPLVWNCAVTFDTHCSTLCFGVLVALCSRTRLTCLHIPQVPEGLPSFLP